MGFAMKDREKNYWFESRRMQVEPRFFKCFGIMIEDRFGGERYISEMMSFCRECAKHDVSYLVQKVEYLGDVCDITTSPQNRPEEFALIVQAARDTISQFSINNGGVDHGGPLADYEESQFQEAVFSWMVQEVRKEYKACPNSCKGKCPFGDSVTEKNCVECWRKAAEDGIMGDEPF